jgi:HTH-type transcriptional regulator / antitoxin HigA
MTMSTKFIIQSVFKDIEAPAVGNLYRQLCDHLPLRVIETGEQHKVALKVLERLIPLVEASDAPDTVAYFSALSQLVQKFESEHYPTEKGTPREVLAYLMESQDLKQVDMAEVLGGQSVVSDVLNGKRELNVNQIRNLSRRFKVSPELFM